MRVVAEAEIEALAATAATTSAVASKRRRRTSRQKRSCEWTPRRLICVPDARSLGSVTRRDRAAGASNSAPLVVTSLELIPPLSQSPRPLPPAGDPFSCRAYSKSRGTVISHPPGGRLYGGGNATGLSDSALANNNEAAAEFRDLAAIRPATAHGRQSPGALWIASRAAALAASRSPPSSSTRASCKGGS